MPRRTSPRPWQLARPGVRAQLPATTVAGYGSPLSSPDLPDFIASSSALKPGRRLEFVSDVESANDLVPAMSVL